jgi:hypothetical protein
MGISSDAARPHPPYRLLKVLEEAIRMTGTTYFDTVIIGGGQAGLIAGPV